MSYDDVIHSSELDPPTETGGSLARQIILSVIAVLLLGAAGWVCAEVIMHLRH